MRFLILGPLKVIDGDREIVLTGRRKTVLAVLLANAGQVVPLEYLIDAVWPDAPPATARRQIQNDISALRRALSHGEAPQTAIVTDGRGFRIRPRPGELDAQVFTDQVTRALDLARRGEPAAAAATLRSALHLWRGGPALLGLTGDTVEAAATRLEEQRLAATEQCLDLELSLGKHHELVGELTELVAAHPLRERLVGQLMRALHGSGRQSEALTAYDRLRTRLADELGLAPGTPLQHLHTAILRNDPSVAPPPETPTTATDSTTAPPVPAQLPPDVPGFTGRDEQVKRLDELVYGDPATVAVIVIAGTAGVGKTALAVHWSHHGADRFPDGQLYVNLHGYARGEPVRPIDALVRFLRSLGMPAGEIPTEENAAAALYRSLLADRRVLVLLDNAADPAQVRPLLPAGPGCAVLVTSRSRLTGLVAHDGARRLSLDVLGADEARLLLERVLGAERVAAEPDAVGELARVCSHLPLALRIAAAILLDNPGRRIADLVAELRRDALDVLDVEGEQSGIRATFDLSYHALAPDARRLFRFSGLVPTADLTREAGAVLAGTTARAAGRLLERLAAAHLSTPHSLGRYTSHDLLHQYAAGRSHQEDTPARRQAALGRLFDWYLQGTDAAAKVLYPNRLRLPIPAATVPGPAFDSDQDALAWLDAERANLVAVIVHAADHGPRPTAWLLAASLRSYFLLRVHQVDLARATEAALRAAEAEGDPRAQAITLLTLSNIEYHQLRYAEARAYCTRALALAEETGWLSGQAAALGILATVYRQTGRIEEAVGVYGRTLSLYRQDGARGGEALALTHIARTYMYLGRLSEAREAASQAVTLYRETGSRQGEAEALDTLGEICHLAGRLDEAMDHLSRALTLSREVGDRGREVPALRKLAEVHRDGGQPGRALDIARSTLAQARPLGEIQITANALNTLAAVHHHLGQHQEAVAHHQQVIELTGDGRNPYSQIVAFIGLAAAWHGLGQTERAVEYGRRALTAAARAGFRGLEQRAQAILEGG